MVENHTYIKNLLRIPVLIKFLVVVAEQLVFCVSDDILTFYIEQSDLVSCCGFCYTEP